MSAALPSQPAPSPRGRRNPLPVEALQEILGALERNRREIVRMQWELSYALSERYG
jgi:hypothetical protein